MHSVEMDFRMRADCLNLFQPVSGRLRRKKPAGKAETDFRFT